MAAGVILYGYSLTRWMELLVPACTIACDSSVDLPHMNMEESTTDWADVQRPAILGQQIRERAQRLYLMGEWNLAAQLLLELATRGRTETPEGAVETVNG